MTCYEKMANVNAQLKFGKDLEISVFYVSCHLSIHCVFVFSMKTQ